MSANLMIVEDDNRVRGAVHLAVEDEGYSVEEAEAARPALSSLCTIEVVSDAAPGAPLILSPEVDAVRRGPAEIDLATLELWPHCAVADGTVRGLGYRLDVQR